MCVRVCGTDNVLYGSDYPHTIGDMAGCLARVDAAGGRRAGQGAGAERAADFRALNPSGARGQRSQQHRSRDDRERALRAAKGIAWPIRGPRGTRAMWP